ncbi:MAG TPA: hypothetical protein VL574_02565 [Stellaceae bacterium]|nr:hypothetical protein [Stellaceae bacterium]
MPVPHQPSPEHLVLELSAAIMAVTHDEPRVLTVGNGAALPSGPLESGHRTLELGLRAWVERQTRQTLGYVEQLYTFADRDRVEGGGNERVIALSYLALAREAGAIGSADAGWQNWYRYFPWEDWRGGPNALVVESILPRLSQWVSDAASGEGRRRRQARVQAIFAADERLWNEELVLQRYELLYEAGAVPEAGGDARMVAGDTMTHDHRRILATGIARLRAKIKYRPVVFELMPDSFTLSQLQRAVEALAGRRLHKQNFRRFIEQQLLVEETGEMVAATGGRPAKLVRFRREVLQERSITGTKLPLARTALV